MAQKKVAGPAGGSRAEPSATHHRFDIVLFDVVLAMLHEICDGLHAAHAASGDDLDDLDDRFAVLRRVRSLRRRCARWSPPVVGDTGTAAEWVEETLRAAKALGGGCLAVGPMPQ